MCCLNWLGGAVGSGMLRLSFIGLFVGLWLALAGLVVACKTLAARISAFRVRSRGPLSHLIGGM
jgi:hypothetical protein